MFTRKDFWDYFAEETISIDPVSTQKPEEPNFYNWDSLCRLNKEVWVLDLAFNQDACPTGQDFAPARSLVLLDINYAIVLQ